MEEKKFCMKSRAELDEIRKQQASKKASMNEAKQMTNKDIRAAFGTLICLPNGNGELTRYLDRYAYNAGTFGWNYDVFISPEDYSVGIVTGYRVPNSMCDFKISYDDMAQAEDEVSALDVRGEEKAKAVNDILMGLLNKTTGGVSESKINEISDELAYKTTEKRRENTNRAIHKGNKKEIRKNLDKEIKNTLLNTARYNRKIGESKINEISDETVEKAYKKSGERMEQIARQSLKGNIPDKEFKQAARKHDRFGTLRQNRAFRKMFKVQSESLTASKALAMSKSILDEISDETVNRVYNKRMRNLAKAQSKYNPETGEGFGDLVDAERKVDRNLTLNLARDKRKREELQRKRKQAQSESKINEISDETVNKTLAKRGEAIDKAYAKKEQNGDLDTAIRKAEKFSKLNQKRLERKYKSESKINESKDYKFDNIVISIYGEPTENSKVVEEKMSGFGMQNLEIINVYNSEDEAVQDHLARIKAGEQPDPLVYETQETIDFINKHHHLPSLDADDFDAEYSAWAD